MKRLLLLLMLPSVAFGAIGTQTLTDAFTRANETPLAGNWTQISPQNLNLVSNAVTMTTLTTGTYAYYNTGNRGGSDNYSQVEVTVSGTSSGAGAGVIVRAGGVGTDIYRLYLKADGGWILDKQVSSVTTTLLTGSVTYVAGTKLGLSVQGSTLTAWYNGTSIGSTTDSAISNGYPGICYVSALTSVSLDNWDAGSGTQTAIGNSVNTDDFNRANETPLAGNWTKGNGAASNFNLSSNTVTLSSTSNDKVYYYNAWASGNDQYSQAEITVSGTGVGTGAGVCVRKASGTTDTYYRLVLASNGNYELGKIVAGAFTSLKTGSVTYSAGTALGLSATGTTLRIYYGGVLQWVVTDSGISTGSPGIAYSSTSTSASFDNWSAGTTPATVAASSRVNNFMFFFSMLCHINFFER